jgi:cell division protein FtsB
MGRTAVLFAACVLLANGLIGERGLTQTMRARRASEQAAREIVRLERENARLRETVRRLREDPAAIETAARSDLGLVRPGEIVVTIRDLKP